MTDGDLLDRWPLDLVRDRIEEGAAFLDRLLMDPEDIARWNELLDRLARAGAAPPPTSHPIESGKLEDIVNNGVVVCVLEGRLSAEDLTRLLLSPHQLVDLADRAQHSAYFCAWREALDGLEDDEEVERESEGTAVVVSVSGISCELLRAWRTRLGDADAGSTRRPVPPARTTLAAEPRRGDARVDRSVGKGYWLSLAFPGSRVRDGGFSLHTADDEAATPVVRRLAPTRGADSGIIDYPSFLFNSRIARVPV